MGFVSDFRNLRVNRLGAPRRKPSAADIMRRLKADPLKHLVARFNAADDDSAEKTSMALELLPYAYPKLKAVEHKGSVASSIVVNIGGDDPDADP